MNNRKQGACGRVDIGGQAVLEGVMMKAPDAIAISVRRPNGTIVTRRTPYVPEHRHAGHTGRGARQI